jgi:hypothetical protein
MSGQAMFLRRFHFPFSIFHLSSKEPLFFNDKWKMENKINKTPQNYCASAYRKSSSAISDRAFITGGTRRRVRLRVAKLLAMSNPTPIPAPKAMRVAVPGFSRL